MESRPNVVQTAFTIALALATVVLALFTYGLWDATQRLADVEASRDVNEGDRAIRLALSRLEQAVTTHRNSLPCTSYVVSLNEANAETIAKWEPFDRELPGEEPQQKLLENCLGRLYILMREQKPIKFPSAVELAYIHEEVYSRLNALEEAATFYEGKKKCDDTTYDPKELDGQRELRRQICGFAPPPVVKMIDLDNKVQNQLYHLNKTAPEISRVCRLLNCQPIAGANAP